MIMMIMMMHFIFGRVNWEILLRIHKQRSVESTLRLCVTWPCSHFDPEDGYSLCLRNVDILTLANGVTTSKIFSNYFTWVEQPLLLIDVVQHTCLSPFVSQKSELWTQANCVCVCVCVCVSRVACRVTVPTCILLAVAADRKHRLPPTSSFRAAVKLSVLYGRVQN